MIELPAVMACVRQANQNKEPKHVTCLYYDHDNEASKCVSRSKDQQLRVPVMVFVLAMYCKNQTKEYLVASQIAWTARYLTHEQHLNEGVKNVKNVDENCSLLAHISTYHVQMIARLLIRSARLFCNKQQRWSGAEKIVQPTATATVE
jgi:hypothetical protein